MMGKIVRIAWDAPIQGLNARSYMTDREGAEASILDNVIVRPFGIQPVRGCTTIVNLGGTGPGSAHSYPATSSTLYVGNGKIGVGTSQLPNTVVNTSKPWFSTGFATAANKYLIFTRTGGVAPVLYDGVGFSALGVTGATLTALFQAVVYRKRLYFCVENSAGFYYLNPDAISGAATFYSIGSLIQKGGAVICAATMSMDGGSGSDDLFMVWTDKGELVVFSGNDPAAPSWSVVGVFNLGSPIGVGASPGVMTKRGGDVLAFTSQQGVIPISKILKGFPPSAEISLSAPIDPLRVSNLEGHISYSDGVGLWLRCTGPSFSTSNQDVFFLPDESGKWSRLYSTNQSTFSVANSFQGLLYVNGNLGGFENGIIKNLFNANQPSGTWAIRTVPSRLGMVGDFRVVSARPRFLAGSAFFGAGTPYQINLGINHDFELFTGNYSPINNIQSQWKTASPMPNHTMFTSGARASVGWVTPESRGGYCAALHYYADAGNGSVPWYEVTYLGTDLILEELSPTT